MPQWREPPIPSDGEGSQSFLPGWDLLTPEQQEALFTVLKDAEKTVRNQYDEQVNKLEQVSAEGKMLAQRDGIGIGRVPIPPLPDLTRDARFERLALDLHRLGTILAYLQAALAYLATQGFDIGVSLAAYTHARTEALAEGRVKATARRLEEDARQAYIAFYSRVLTFYPERVMQRVMDWDETSRQQDSWVDKLRRMLTSG